MIAKDIKRGRVVNYNGAPCLIEAVSVQTPSARGAATFYKFRARDLSSRQKVDIALRGGVSVESSVIPSGGIAIGPTGSPGIGGRFFLSRGSALKIEFRDDLLVERRSLTQSTEFKQNANVSLGLVLLSPKKESRR